MQTSLFFQKTLQINSKKNWYLTAVFVSVNPNVAQGKLETSYSNINSFSGRDGTYSLLETAVA